MGIDKDKIKNNVKRIRKEIGHDEMEINIKELNFNEDLNELTIITTDRPDKSSIIGKGGWVVGRLKEDLNLNSIHVESYTDFIQKEYRLKLSYERIESVIDSLDDNNPVRTPLINLKNTLKYKINNIYTFNLEKYLDENFIKNLKEKNNKHLSVVALSGGVDSSFSLLVAKYLGFKPKAISVDPGSIILPSQFKQNINNLTKKLNVEHEYIKIKNEELINEALSGKIHPCGRCSKQIEEGIFKYALNNNISLVIFGDMLSTGSQCITDNIHNNQNIKRLNLPSTLSCGKLEGKNLIKNYPVKSIKGFGCPLLYEVHKKYPHLKKYSIQRILRETRAGALEVGEALELIWSFYRA